MKNGCKRDICVNLYCKNNPNFNAPLNDSEMLTTALKLWKSFHEEQKVKYWDICCDPEYQKNTYKTLQANNIDQFLGDFGFLIEFVHSPYAFSLSFLKDPSIIGKNDDYG